MSKKKKKKSKLMTISLPEEFYDGVKKLADAGDRSVSQQVRRMLKQVMEKKDA